MSADHPTPKRSWRTAWQRLLAGSLLEAQLHPPLQRNVAFRLYEPRDFAACLTIYQKNAPGRFPEKHEHKFVEYLREEKKTFIVAECESRIVGYGGVSLGASNTATLVYGIIDPEFQRQRIGSTLTLLRIAQLPANPNGIYVTICAVDASMPIYARFGFTEIGKWQPPGGEEYPYGVLHVARSSLEVVKSTLKRRGVRVQGEVTLHRSEDTSGEVEKREDGSILIRFHEPAQPTEPRATPQ